MNPVCERCDVELDEENSESLEQDLCDFCRDEGYIGSGEADAIYEAYKHGDYHKK